MWIDSPSHMICKPQFPPCGPRTYPCIQSEGFTTSCAALSDPLCQSSEVFQKEIPASGGLLKFTLHVLVLEIMDSIRSICGVASRALERVVRRFKSLALLSCRTEFPCHKSCLALSELPVPPRQIVI